MRPAYAEARATCHSCGQLHQGVERRIAEILGPAFFLVMQLDDLSDDQRADVEWRAWFCNDECVAAAQVEVAMKLSAPELRHVVIEDLVVPDNMLYAMTDDEFTRQRKRLVRLYAARRQ